MDHASRLFRFDCYTVLYSLYTGSTGNNKIFIAFFKKDHSTGLRHWKLNDPVVGKSIKSSKSRQGRRGGTAYPLTMSATYAWGNIYRVAHAKGVVRFRGAQNREIMVENFTYNLTGDP